MVLTTCIIKMRKYDLVSDVAAVCVLLHQLVLISVSYAEVCKQLLFKNEERCF